ncbi:GntR family transcriptional regulator [Paracoccus sp. (in: a-proteobacteria)]|uniref:GntR family transcriptional regulator n=1 Tax=Paracoccus sp. TaxID=267 RepID=UPI00396CF3B9
MEEAKAENASERAYRELRLAIVEGQLPSDRKVTELALAERFNISRTPVREAIKRLLLEGLLERRKGQGLWCALPDDDQVREIFDLRLRLEAYAAGRAAERATAQQIDDIGRSAQRMADLAETASVTDDLITRIDQENARFHALIIESTQSKRLIHLVKATVDISLVSRTFRQFTTEQRRRSARHHLEIAAAIAARSPQWAERMMEVHILSAAETFGLTTEALPDNGRSR